MRRNPWQRSGGCVSTATDDQWACMTNQAAKPQVHLFICHSLPFQQSVSRSPMSVCFGACVWHMKVFYIKLCAWNEAKSELWVAIRDSEGVVVFREPLFISVPVWQMKQPNHRCTCIFVIVRHFRSLFRGQQCRCVLVRVLGIWRCFILDYVFHMK